MQRELSSTHIKVTPGRGTEKRVLSGTMIQRQTVKGNILVKGGVPLKVGEIDVCAEVAQQLFSVANLVRCKKARTTRARSI